MLATVSVTAFKKTLNNFALSRVDCTKWHGSNNLYKQTESCSCFLTKYIQDCPYYMMATKSIGEVHTKSSIDLNTIKFKLIWPCKIYVSL